MSEAPRRSERFVAREARELRKEVLVSPWPELGLVALDGPDDPDPELAFEDGRVVRIDGRGIDQFDLIDHFLARHGFDPEAAEQLRQALQQSLRQIAQRQKPGEPGEPGDEADGAAIDSVGVDSIFAESAGSLRVGSAGVGSDISRTPRWRRYATDDASPP